MDKNYSQLQQRVAELEKIILALQSSNSIPSNIEKALTGRGFLKTSNIEKPPGDWDINEGFIVATVPPAQAPATQYLRLLNIGGTNYWIALYTFSELA